MHLNQACKSTMHKLTDYEVFKGVKLLENRMVVAVGWKREERGAVVQWV